MSTLLSSTASPSHQIVTESCPHSLKNSWTLALPAAGTLALALALTLRRPHPHPRPRPRPHPQPPALGPSPLHPWVPLSVGHSLTLCLLHTHIVRAPLHPRTAWRPVGCTLTLCASRVFALSAGRSLALCAGRSLTGLHCLQVTHIASSHCPQVTLRLSPLALGTYLN